MSTTTTTNLSTLKINYLTQSQYDTALDNNQINENEIYMTPTKDMTTQEVDDFIDELDITGSKTAADLVVEQGISGIWTYRKWSSGIAECWGMISWSVTGWTAWGSLYYSTYSGTVNYPNGLFISAPILTSQSNAPTHDCWLGTRSGSGAVNTKDHTTDFYLLRPTTGSTSTIGCVNVYAIGTWKQEDI